MDIPKNNTNIDENIIIYGSPSSIINLNQSTKSPQFDAIDLNNVLEKYICEFKKLLEQVSMIDQLSSIKKNRIIKLIKSYEKLLDPQSSKCPVDIYAKLIELKIYHNEKIDNENVFDSHLFDNSLEWQNYKNISSVLRTSILSSIIMVDNSLIDKINDLNIVASIMLNGKSCSSGDIMSIMKISKKLDEKGVRHWVLKKLPNFYVDNMDDGEKEGD